MHQLSRKGRAVNQLEFLDRDMNPIEEVPLLTDGGSSNSQSTSDSEYDPDDEPDTDVSSKYSTEQHKEDLPRIDDIRLTLT